MWLTARPLNLNAGFALSSCTSTRSQRVTCSECRVTWPQCFCLEETLKTIRGSPFILRRSIMGRLVIQQPHLWPKSVLKWTTSTVIFTPYLQHALCTVGNIYDIAPHLKTSPVAYNCKVFSLETIHPPIPLPFSHLPIHPSVHVSVHPPTHLFTLYQPIYLSTNVFSHPSTHPLTHLLTYSCIQSPIHPPTTDTCISAPPHQPIHLATHPFILRLSDIYLQRTFCRPA